MADLKISQLPAATTPLAGTEVLPIVQSGSTVQVSVNNLFVDNTTAANTQALTNKDLTSGTNTFPSSLATLTGTQTLTNKTIEAGTFTNGYTEEVFALGTSGTLALNPVNGSIQTCALAGNPTFTDSLASGQSLVLMLTGGSSRTVTFPTMTWVTSGGNVAPTLTAADALVFWKISTTLYGAVVGSFE